MMKYANNKGTDQSVHPQSDQLICYSLFDILFCFSSCVVRVEFQSKKYGKDQESIQTSTTPDPGYHTPKAGFLASRPKWKCVLSA